MEEIGVKMVSKEYIIAKIKSIDGLIERSHSLEEADAYREFREFWSEQLPKSNTTATTDKPLIEEFIEKPEASIEQVIEGKLDIADKMEVIADQLVIETAAISYVCQQGWNDEFENLFPKKAIWQGQITASFAEWLKETKGYN